MKSPANGCFFDAVQKNLPAPGFRMNKDNTAEPRPIVFSTHSLCCDTAALLGRIIHRRKDREGVMLLLCATVRPSW